MLNLFSWPFKTVMAVGQKVKEEAEKEWYDLDTIQKKMVQLEMAYEMEEIEEEEYIEQQKVLENRYELAKKREMDELEGWIYEEEGRS